ncbi:hypothetical protein [Nesterenkonia lutea]|uniref:Amidohydrolase 3 domain-containing protein n=1 Tax=Nesterenkonia lutea TaxID=272919 RepID=A0ABR9JD56_9MICC|nr:hypothetical protein [Nesterenkonia lutea]MBE1523868.1 hypothetical protein [Nesterenkonia lutea]
MNDTGAGHPARLLTNGTIHSPSEPYADAMVVEEGLIAWVGSSETAEKLNVGSMVVQNLDRALVAPAFVGWVDIGVEDASDLAVQTTQTLEAAAGRGFGAVRLNLELAPDRLAQASAESMLETVFSAAAAHAVRVYPVLTVSGLGSLESSQRLPAIEKALALLGPVDSILGRPVAIQLDLATVLDQLVEVRAGAALARRQLILRTVAPGRPASQGAAGEDLAPAELVAALVDSTSRLREQRRSPAGSLPTVLAGFDSAAREDWEALLNTGIQVLIRGAGHLATALSVGVPVSAVGEPGENPWSVVTRHVHHPQDPVSVRAGFNAQTRGAYRSLPEASGTPASSAQLDAGSRATYGVWDVDSLAVQTPDSRTAAWSTDVRARTPLLPYLDGETLPTLVSTVIDGREVHPPAGAALP